MAQALAASLLILILSVVVVLDVVLSVKLGVKLLCTLLDELVDQRLDQWSPHQKGEDHLKQFNDQFREDVRRRSEDRKERVVVHASILPDLLAYASGQRSNHSIKNQ
jgi:hypothetical protein